MEPASAAVMACPSCGSANPPGARFCNACGAVLSQNYGHLAGGGEPPPPPSIAPSALPLPISGSGSWLAPPTPPTSYRAAQGDKGRDRTVSGLLIMILGFAIIWVPYVDLLGGLLLLVGVILVFLGRDSFPGKHSTYVSVGGAMVILGLVASLVVGVSFAVGVESEAMTPGLTLSQFGTALQGDLYGLFVAAAVVGAITYLGYVLLVYALADRATRAFLWGGFLSELAVSVGLLVYLVPKISAAISQATSGTTVDLTPISQLQSTDTILGALNIIPALLFAWSYYRLREQAKVAPREPRPFDRIPIVP